MVSLDCPRLKIMLKSNARKMSRKNLKINEETYDRLRDAKGQFETWDGMLNRLVDQADE